MGRQGQVKGDQLVLAMSLWPEEQTSKELVLHYILRSAVDDVTRTSLPASLLAK